MNFDFGDLCCRLSNLVCDLLRSRNGFHKIRSGTDVSSLAAQSSMATAGTRTSVVKE